MRRPAFLRGRGLFPGEPESKKYASKTDHPLGRGKLITPETCLG